MKKIIVVLAGVLFAFAVNAQDTKTEAAPQTVSGDQTMKPHPVMHDFITMKEGKMMMMKEGKLIPMEKEMEMSNGSKVMMDGTVMKKDGTKIMMKEGDRMTMNGTLRMAGEKKKMEEKKTDSQEQK